MSEITLGNGPPEIECVDGLCVAIVHDWQLLEMPLQIGEDARLATVKDRLVAEMAASDAHSGILLLAPATGTRRFGAIPDCWLAEHVGVEISERSNLVRERKSMFLRYQAMMAEMEDEVLLEEDRPREH